MLRFLKDKFYVVLYILPLVRLFLVFTSHNWTQSLKTQTEISISRTESLRLLSGFLGSKVLRKSKMVTYLFISREMIIKLPTFDHSVFR